MFRVGVSTTSPEGQRWSAIKTPNSYEAIQISVGPTGLAWVILTNGKALVRTGVCRENLMGKLSHKSIQPEVNLLYKMFHFYNFLRRRMGRGRTADQRSSANSSQRRH